MLLLILSAVLGNQFNPFVTLYYHLKNVNKFYSYHPGFLWGFGELPMKDVEDSLGDPGTLTLRPGQQVALWHMV